MTWAQSWQKNISLDSPVLFAMSGGIAVAGTEGIDLYSTSGSTLASFRGSAPIQLGGLWDACPMAGGAVLLGLDVDVASHVDNVNTVNIVTVYADASGGTITFGEPAVVGQMQVWDGTGDSFVDHYVATLDSHEIAIKATGYLVRDGSTVKSVIGSIMLPGDSDVRTIWVDTATLDISGSDVTISAHTGYASDPPFTGTTGEQDDYLVKYVLPWGDRGAGAHVLIDGKVEFVSEKGSRYTCVAPNSVVAPGDGPVDGEGSPSDATAAVDDVSNYGIVKHYDYSIAG